MNWRFVSIGILLLSGTCCAGNVLAASVLTLTVSEELVTGGVTSYSVQDQDVFSKILTSGSGSSSLASLKSYNQNTGDRAYINRSSWQLSEVFLTPDTPGTDSATVMLGGQLTATMSGYDNGGVFDGATGRLFVDYHVSYFANGQTQVFAGNAYSLVLNSFDFVDDTFGEAIDEFVGFTLTLPTNTPITFAMALETRANAQGGSATVNASNSLSFDPDSFFDIQTQGVAANAGTFIVNNSLPAHVVPVPAAVWLSGSGLLALVLATRRRAD